MTVASAHRSPARVMRLVDEAPGRGVKVFIVGAGAAAHLGGVVAAHTTLPVIGVPIDSSALKGLDALLVDGADAARRAGRDGVDRQARRDQRRRPRRADPRRRRPGDGEEAGDYKKKLADKVEAAAARLNGRRLDEGHRPRRSVRCRARIFGLMRASAVGP